MCSPRTSKALDLELDLELELDLDNYNYNYNYNLFKVCRDGNQQCWYRRR